LCTLRFHFLYFTWNQRLGWQDPENKQSVRSNPATDQLGRRARTGREMQLLSVRPHFR
jgi:hypothetical protein